MTTSRYDPLTVEHALAGYRVPLTAPERREVVHRLTVRGWSSADIGRHVNVTTETVQRDRRDWTPRPDDDPAALPVPARPFPEEDFDDHAMRACAARVIGSVHDLENVWDELAVMPPDQVRALVIVLAAACDPDQPINAMLAWVDQLADGIAS
ncbi:hypothetical protein [Gordonia sp. (in: high G+C Gram-positive bacteria)]|uniref:hypothetical protein n=1 Tax=Gordonia sp. (in: high G+C Gram-positive bacteria) TaxID=84139 RepID=UPI002629F566|nr:hypothetical protein [Gordonia sp. (in: high G+C Gram-positive bacteria)]